LLRLPAQQPEAKLLFFATLLRQRRSEANLRLACFAGLLLRLRRKEAKQACSSAEAIKTKQGSQAEGDKKAFGEAKQSGDKSKLTDPSKAKKLKQKTGLRQINQKTITKTISKDSLWFY
jgi:hypothetical protein